MVGLGTHWLEKNPTKKWKPTIQMETSVIQEKQHNMDARKMGLCGRGLRGTKLEGSKIVLCGHPLSSSWTLQGIKECFWVLGLWLCELCLGPLEMNLSFLCHSSWRPTPLGCVCSATEPEKWNQSRLPGQWLDNKHLKGSLPSNGDSTMWRTVGNLCMKPLCKL